MATYQPLFDQALDAPPHGAAYLHRHYKFSDHATLTRPIIEFDRWQDIERIGKTKPEPWSPSRALQRLGVRQVTWTNANGPSHGYAQGLTFAINQRCYSPVRTLMHELSHIVLLHSDTTTADLPRWLKEVEAELSTFCVLALIGATSTASVTVSSAYLDHWRRGDIPAESLDVVSRAVTRIHGAGRTT